MKYITSIPFTNYATILFSLLINIVMTAIVHNDLNGAFQFYSGLPIGLVFAILLFFYLLVSKRLLFVQLIITALTTSLLFLWVRNVPIDNSIFDALTTSLLLVVSLAICLGIVWITSSSTNLFYNIILIQTLIATLSYTLCFTLQFFYINYIIVFGFIYLYSAYRQQAHPQSGLVSPWILSTLYIFTLAIFIINEVIAESVFSKFLQFYNFRERGELLSNICSNSYSTFQHSLLSAKSYLFSAWEIEGSAPQTNPPTDSPKFSNVSEMRRSGSNGIKGTYITPPSKATSSFSWSDAIGASAGLKTFPPKGGCAAISNAIQEEEEHTSCDLPLEDGNSRLSNYDWRRRAILSDAASGTTPAVSSSTVVNASESNPPRENNRFMGVVMPFMLFPLEYAVRDSTLENWVIGRLTENSTIVNIARGERHFILVNRRSLYDLISIFTTSTSTIASESTCNNYSLVNFRAEPREDGVERVSTVRFSDKAILQPFRSKPYLDKDSKPKSQYLASTVIVSEPGVTDKLLAEGFYLKSELNVAIKEWNLYNMKRAVIAILERSKIERSDPTYPPTADGDDYLKCLYLKYKTK